MTASQMAHSPGPDSPAVVLAAVIIHRPSGLNARLVDRPAVAA